MPVVIFTKHAKTRLKERGISVALIKKALQQPDRIVRGKETTAYSKNIGAQNLTVIVAAEAHKLIIITAYYENHLR